MFEIYTEKARRLIFFARYEASQFGTPYIETEHLLLGLLREDKALPNRFLGSHDAIESIRKEVKGRTPVREKTSTSIDLPLSQECKRVLGYAAEEAERLSHKHIGMGHLLLGLLREDKSFAAEILRKRGLRLSTIREEVGRGLIEKPSAARTSPLSLVSRDLIEAASEDELDPLVGRETELARVIQVLCRRSRNNPVLVGEPGVGKTAIVHGLARRMANGNVPSRLESKRLLALDLSPIMAVTAESRQFEERLIAILNELMEAANLIVFIEDLFTHAGARGSLNIANLLKPLLTQGEIQCIAAATPGDYGKAIGEERWIEGCFDAVDVVAPDEAEAVKVLFGIKQRYERFHSVTYTDEALQYAVYHSQRYIPGRHLPDKAIDLIDEAGAGVALRVPQEVIDVQTRIKFVVRLMENAIANHEFNKAKFYSDEELKERENLRQLREKYNLDATATVTLDDIENVVARRTGVPLATIRQERGSAGPGGHGG
jgi:ATP-dependent Clp protease ATP-binding subunit ClpC